MSPAGGSTRGRVDVVEWARHLGVGTSDEVWAHVMAAAADASGSLDVVASLMARTAAFPEEDLTADLSSAFGLIEQVGLRLLDIARTANES